MIGLSVKYLFFSIGDADFFSSFFFTIHYHLEKESWGDTYPCTLNELYMGVVNSDRLLTLEKEIGNIKEKLKLIPPSQIVWDIEDLNKKPPWGDNISEEISDLSNYFVTSSGNKLFDVMFNAINEAKKLKSDIRVRNTFQRPDLPID